MPLAQPRCAWQRMGRRITRVLDRRHHSGTATYSGRTPTDSASLMSRSTPPKTDGRMFRLWTCPDDYPYLGTVIQEAITFQQNTRWVANIYVGPWSSGCSSYRVVVVTGHQRRGT
jgi:hypothetical protein